MPKPPKPVSPKRAAANRANATHSTKHSFTAAKFVVARIEDVAEVEQLREDAIATYQPENSQELFAVERIVLAQMSLTRIAHLEAGIFTNCLDEAMEGPARPFILETPELTEGADIALEQHRAFWLASGFRRVAQNDKVLALFLRYQAQAERLYRRAVEEFERLKQLRHEIPNEPIEESQLDETPIPPAHPSRPQPQPVSVHPPAPSGARSTPGSAANSINPRSSAGMGGQHLWRSRPPAGTNRHSHRGQFPQPS